MKLNNPFSTETRWLFFDIRYICGNCGGNGTEDGGIEGHHILGRCSKSKFNFIWLCKKCHDKKIHTDEQKTKFLQKTARYIFSLIKQGITKLEEEDKIFLNENKKYYEVE